MNKANLHERTIALAAALQAIDAALLISHNKTPPTYHALIQSLFQFKAPTIHAIYGEELQALAPGFSLVAHIFQDKKRFHTALSMHYFLRLNHAAKLLQRKPELQNYMRDHLLQLNNQLQYFSVDQDLILQQIARIYDQSIGQLPCHIRLRGIPEAFAEDADLKHAILRSLLLAALRAIILWRQYGGNYLHLAWWERKTIAHTAQELSQNLVLPTH
jgi:high frequency lysogenization protein